MHNFLIVYISTTKKLTSQNSKQNRYPEIDQESCVVPCACAKQNNNRLTEGSSEFVEYGIMDYGEVDRTVDGLWRGRPMYLYL